MCIQNMWMDFAVAGQDTVEKDLLFFFFSFRFLTKRFLKRDLIFSFASNEVYKFKGGLYFFQAEVASVTTVFNIYFRVCSVTIRCLFKRLLDNSNLEEHYWNIGLPARRKYALIE